MNLEIRWSAPASLSLAEAAPIEPISEKVGFELHGLLVIKKIKVIYSVSDEAINIEYIKNTYLSDKTMLERMGYCL